MKALLLLISFNLFLYSNSFFQKDESIKVKEPFFRDPNFFPKSIEEEYAHYTELKNIENGCNLMPSFENFPKLIFNTIKEKKCLLNSNSFTYLLNEGLIEEAKYVIENIYLPNDIDPSYEVKNWISKKEGRIRQINKMLSPDIGNSIVKSQYSFINYDNYVKFVIKLNDTYLSEKLTVVCYKNMIIIKGTFFKNNQNYLLNERKRLFDEVEENCDFNYNQFNSELEVTMTKIYKLKKWDSLFNQ